MRCSEKGCDTIKLQRILVLKKSQNRKRVGTTLVNLQHIISLSIFGIRTLNLVYFEGKDTVVYLYFLTAPPHHTITYLYHESHTNTVYEFHNESNCIMLICSHLYDPISINNYALSLNMYSIHS